MLISDTTIVLTAGIIFCAAFTRSAMGFGDALISMPLLTIILGIDTATPLAAFVSTTIAISILVGSWRKVNVHAAWRLILSSFAGIPLGLLWLKGVSDALVTALLGIILVLFGLYKLFKPKLTPLKNEKLAIVFGFVAGIFGGAYNTNGPPIVIYGTLRRWTPEQFRASLQFYFLPTGLLILSGHGLAGLWTPAVFRLYAVVFPAIIIAVLVGGKLNRRFPEERFQQIVYSFLVVIGVFLMI